MIQCMLLTMVYASSSRYAVALVSSLRVRVRVTKLVEPVLVL